MGYFYPLLPIHCGREWENRHYWLYLSDNKCNRFSSADELVLNCGWPREKILAIIAMRGRYEYSYSTFFMDEQKPKARETDILEIKRKWLYHRVPIFWRSQDNWSFGLSSNIYKLTLCFVILYKNNHYHICMRFMLSISKCTLGCPYRLTGNHVSLPFVFIITTDSTRSFSHWDTISSDLINRCIRFRRIGRWRCCPGCIS